MHHTILKYIFLNFTLFLCSCNSKNIDPKEDRKLFKEGNDFFSNNRIQGMNSGQTLTLKTLFDECGEWGGHHEEMHIYVIPGKGFYLDYKKNSVNCELMDTILNIPKQNLKKTKTITLNESNKVSIKNYLKKLFKSKLDETSTGSSAKIFIVTNSDSSLVLRVRSNKVTEIKNYIKLQKELGL